MNILKIICISLFLFIFSVPVYEADSGSLAAKSALPDMHSSDKQTKNIDAAIGILNYNELPLYFIKNAGQKDDIVKYYAKTKKYHLWITNSGLVFDSIASINSQEKTADNDFQRDVYRLLFIGANEHPIITADDKSGYRVSYFIGSEKSDWIPDIPTSTSIIYKNLYDRIDLKIYGKESEIEYDWKVMPKGDVAKIKFIFKDVEKAVLDNSGDLIVSSLFGETVHKKPEAYQIINGYKNIISAEYIQMPDGSFGLQVSDYDKNYELIIDPLTIPYSTYIGGTDVEYGYSIAVDSSGCAYITGYSNSVNYPVQNPYQWWRTGNEVFVTKFSSSGASLIYSTYIGGSGTDRANGIALDSSNNAYITGYTTSNNYPMVNAYDSTYSASNEVFVTKIAPAGNTLVYSTYIGDTLSDIGNAIAVDSSNRAYVTGTTTSTTFPIQNAYDNAHNGGTDAFVLRLAAAGNSLEYSTFLGTAGTDEAYSIAVDSAFSAYVTGRTNNSTFPTLNPYQAARSGGYDAFVTKFSAPGNTLVYSTYLGGASDEESRSITVDTSGSTYIFGNTTSNNFPTFLPYQAARSGAGDLFITKLAAAGNSLVFSTYLGGTGNDYARGIGIDSTNSVYLTGYTTSTNFPTFAATQSAHAGGTNDAFVTNLSSTGGSLLYSTYFGGTASDIGWAIAVSTEPAAFVCGYTLSTDFPMNNAYDNVLGGTTDAFCAKFLWYTVNIPPVAVAAASPTTGQFPLLVNFDGSGSSDSDGTIVSYTWDFGDGNTGSGMYVSYTYNTQGTFTATLTVTDNSGGTATDTVMIQVSNNIPPVVVFNASPVAGTVPLTVNFDASQSYDPDGSISAYRLNFGDGTSTSIPRASHIYTKIGTFYAMVRVTDNTGLFSTGFVRIDTFDIAAVSCVIDTYGVNRIKANGKGETLLGVILIDSISSTPAIILPQLDVQFGATSGTFLDSMTFESSRALYNQRLSSGTPGTATITAYISGTAKCTAAIEYSWPKSPAQVQLRLAEDRSLFRAEYSGILTWQQNPYEIYPPAAYRVYRSIDDSPFEAVMEVDSSVFRMDFPHLSKDRKYSFAVSTVDTEGDESDLSPIVSSK